MTTTTGARVRRRTFALVAAGVVLLVGVFFAVRWGVEEARVSDCVGKVGIPGAITPESVEDVCRGVPGAHLQPVD